ncbi:amino acid adenylation domain-containing protein [Streptomyces sp. NPDC047841]|uniref:amino acid adenylation domain-containing protein n=1 Tax=Streptomyces sp. NPDC047841 TaxID=3154708 RepID=UPI003456D284
MTDVADLLARLKELPPQQRALVERKLRERGGPKTYETSVTQQGLWLIDQITPDDRLYTIGWRLRFGGRLDTDALTRAVDALVARHAALRTTFTVEDGRPLQAVQPRLRIPVPVDDLRELDGPAREQRTADLCAAEVATPFDLEKGPLVRFRLIRVADEEHVFTIVVHHIVFDAVSVDVALRDLSRVYNALVAGDTLPDTAPAPQYPEFARWQRRHLTGPRLEQLIGYWRRQLAGAPGLLALPTLRPRPAEQSHAGAEYTAVLPVELSERLRDLASEERSSLYTVLLAGFQLVLSRYSGQRDILVGTVVHGRVRSEFEQMIGYFVNTLVIRGDLTGDPSFREHLRRTRATFLSACDHQALSFDRLVEELAPHRGLSHNPLVQVVFESHDEDEWQQRTRFTGLEMGQLLPIELGRSKFDLNVSAVERGGTIDVTVEYATDLFDEPGVARMVAHYRQLLESAVAQPDTPIGALEMLLPRERLLLTEQPAPPGRPACLHDLVRRHAIATPQEPAVTHGERTLSYGDLDAGATRLAQRLTTHGVTPETVVAVALPPSPDHVLVTLALLKAGAVCLPVDPRATTDTLRAVLADARPALVITDKAALREPLDAETVLLLDDEALTTDTVALAGTPRPARVLPGQAAFLLYTGADDAEPHGVLLTHGGLANGLHHTATTLAVTPGSSVRLHGAPGTDLALWETFTALTTGAHLAIASADQPSTHHLTVVEGPGRARVLTLMDEGPVTRGARQDSEDAPTIGYGQTETSVHALTAELRPTSSGLLPAAPAAAVRVLVLDADLRRLPPGVTGELYIGGPGLALGYHGRPARTAARFLPDPYGPPGARMFRTGDLARLDDRGRVVVLGRAAHRVLVHGLPLEPGAVEAALRNHPAVERAVVSTADHADGPRPVAHVVPAPGATVDPGELRRYVAGLLAAHMVPVAVLVAGDLPTAPNGRLDRAALPAPDPDCGPAGREPVTPREAVLRDLFADVLGLPSVGIDDDFFDIGGHSMLAARLIARVSDVLNVEMRLRTLFEAPTVAELARALETADEAPEAVAGDLDVVLPPRIQSDGTSEPGRPVSGLSPEDLPPRQSEPVDADSIALRAALDGAAPVPASTAQRALWFLDRVMEPGDRSAYNLGKAMTLHGPVDPDLMERCLTEIVRRHQVLRTTFTAKDGLPMQVVHEAAPVRLPVRDVTALPSAERAAAVRALAECELSRPFDLAQGPLFRTLLVRSAPAEHTLVLVFHHAVFDGWSFGVLFDELAALYAAFGAGDGSPLAEPALQYTDYSLWQQSRFDQGALTEGLAYWRRALHGAPGLLALPTDRPRPATASYTGAQLAFVLPPELTAAVRSRARAEGCTLYMVLLAVYQVLLARLSGQREVLVGSHVACRPRTELEGLLGFFVNTVVLRGEAADELSFRTYLRRTRQTVLEALEHQDVPFELVVEELKPERTLSHNPLFQAMFTLQNSGAEDPVRLPGIETVPCEVTTRDAKFDLSLDVVEDGETLRCEIGYRTDLFEPETARRLSRRYTHLLAQFLVEPERTLGSADLLLPEEASALLRQGRGPVVPGTPGTLHGLIEEQVRRTPDAPAVLCDRVDTPGEIRVPSTVEGEVAPEREELSYTGLNERANRLARALVRHGVGPESLVAVALPRSADLIVALLAVLKAGGAYVPIDLDYPADRIGYILDDARPVTVITQTSFQETNLLSGRHCAGVLLLDAPETMSLLSDLDGTDLTHSDRNGLLSPEHPAYVIYTSGSTGRPKGVTVSHSSVINQFAWMQREYELTAADRVLHKTPVGFDVSLWELFWPLMSGASIVVARPGGHRDTRYLTGLIQDERVTVVQFVPSMLQVFLDDRRARDCVGLRLVICIGEALPPELHRAFDALFDVPLHNLYGPTEATVAVTSWTGRPMGPDGGPTPIGRPIDNTQVYVLDASLQLVPPGVAGELYLSGAQLARGYFRRPALSAERFLPNPYGGPGERMYRTGDVVKWNADGTLAYLGRTDDQVKVRGFRIELGEIESALLTHPAVRQAAAAVREDIPGDKRIVAYVVPTTGAAPKAALLRAHVAAVLPEYMVPAAVVTLEALPLTANGKLDRSRLPAPAVDRPTREAVERPRTLHERQVADAWAEVLHRDDIGLHDNFFDLGGNSLSAMRMVARIEQACGRTVRPAAVFQAPTVEQLAALLSREDATADASPLVTLRGSGAGAPVFLVHPIGGNVLCYAGLCDELGSDRPVHGLVARGLSDEEVPRDSIEAMASAYLAALPKAATDGPFLLAGWSMGGVVALEMARQFLQSTGRTLPVVMLDSHPPRPTVDPHGEHDEIALLADFAADWGGTLDVDFGLAHSDLAETGVRAGLERLLAHAKAAGVLSPDDDVVLLDRLFRTYAAHAVAMDRYRPATPYPGPVTLLATPTGRPGDAVDHGWSHQVTGPLSVVEVPGDHYSILREPLLPHTAAALRAQLTASDPS